MGIRVITGPSIYVVGRQTVDEAELSRLLADEGVSSWETDTEVGGEKLAEVAGRLCYMSFARPRPGGNAAYLGHILESGHGSVLEHEVFSLVVTGVSRSFTHELIRHRAGISPSQLSQRYVDESDVAFVLPPALASSVLDAQSFLRAINRDSAVSYLADARRNFEAVAPDIYPGLSWLRAMEYASDIYAVLSESLDESLSVPDRTLRRKRAREAARSVLPNCTETKVFLTANARALRNVIEQRGSAHADAEIRRFAFKLLEVLAKESPNVFGDYAVKDGPDGQYIDTDHRKV